MNKINTRYLVYKILYAIETDEGYVDKVLDEMIKKYDVSLKDDKLVRKIVYGYLENKLLLNYYIEKLAKRPLNQIDLDVRLILAIGMYQIEFLDRIPNSAAVNESVKVAKKVNFKTKGFVNGVLRNFIRKRESLKLPAGDKVERLSVQYSYPKWLLEYFISNYGFDETKKMVAFNQKEATLVIRTNTLKNSRRELLLALKKDGFNARPSELTQAGIKIENPTGLLDTQLFTRGCFYIQDDASILVGELLAPQPNEQVIDVCAAPGGKTTHMVQLMKDQGIVLSRDISEEKIDLINENIKRLGLTSVTTEIFDATSVDSKKREWADKVLVDAPCSGLGLIRKKPDIKYNRQLKDLETLATIQYKILEASAQLLKPGGTMVYSTCTLGSKENLEVIEKFIYNNKGFTQVPIEGKKYVELLPHKSRTDGFFICKLKKD